MIEGFDIVKAADVQSKLKKHRDNYREKGKYLGWDKMHEHYSMTLGSTTEWTGFPRSGKSQVLQESLLNTSMWYGWGHVIYFPDVGTPIEIIADLLHKKTGKSFDPDANNTITDQDITREIDWLLHHFIIITKTNPKGKMTPVEYWDWAIEMKKEKDHIKTISIDSWKDMNHPYKEFGGYGQYLEYILPHRNLIAELNDVHIHTIVHPKDTEKDKATGKRKPPSPLDIKGGPEWFNSGKCMITVYRDSMTDNAVKILFTKIKPRSAGKVGAITLWFDEETLTYYDIQKANKKLIWLYASEQGVNIPQTPKVKQPPKNKEEEKKQGDNGQQLAFK